jgi:short-subunit dehydrogenase
MDYKGLLALVTGASSGIGAVFARRLAERGCDLVLVARRHGKLESLSRMLNSQVDVEVEVLPADLSVTGAGAALAESLAARGVQVDVLVNNAGFGLYAPVRHADPRRISEQVMLNVAAVTDLTQALLPGMLARDRGAVINVASTAAFQPVPYMSVYGATKAYVLSFTEALWAETRHTNVRVTALCPGATDTEFFDVAGESASIGRRMAPEPVVDAALRALERRRSAVTPGLTNWLLANSTRFGSRRTVARMAERTMRATNTPEAADQRVRTTRQGES